MEKTEIEYLCKSLYEYYYELHKREFDEEELNVFGDNKFLQKIEKEEIVKYISNQLLNNNPLNIKELEIKTNDNKIILTLSIKK